MLDNIDIDWVWMLAGFVFGIVCSWFVSDLVYPINRK